MVIAPILRTGSFTGRTWARDSCTVAPSRSCAFTS